MSIAEMSGSSVVTVHVVVVEQQLVVFQTPPPTLRRIGHDRAVGVVVGSTTIAFTRPSVLW